MEALEGLKNLARQASALTKPLDSEAAALKEKQANVGSVSPGAPVVAKPAPTTPAPSDRLHPKARYGSRPGEQRIDTSDMSKPLGSFKNGTDYVPKTGTYQLHEGEAVVPKEKNMDIHSTMKRELGAAKGKTPKKEIKEIVTRRSHDGKMIHTHKHHHPEHHPDEEHVSMNMADLHNHFENHAGTPNMGEEPDGDEMPQMTAAPSPAPAAE